MCDCRRSLAVVLQGLLLVAQLFIGLSNHACDERIVLVRFEKLLELRLILARIKRNIALQVRKELCLLRVGSLVKDVPRSSNVLSSFGLIPTSGSDARAPNETPKGLADQV